MNRALLVRANRVYCPRCTPSRGTILCWIADDCTARGIWGYCHRCKRRYVVDCVAGMAFWRGDG